MTGTTWSCRIACCQVVVKKRNLRLRALSAFRVNCFFSIFNSRIVNAPLAKVFKSYQAVLSKRIDKSNVVMISALEIVIYNPVFSKNLHSFFSGSPAHPKFSTREMKHVSFQKNHLMIPRRQLHAPA